MMTTVGELIKELEKYPSEWKVAVSSIDEDEPARVYLTAVEHVVDEAMRACDFEDSEEVNIGDHVIMIH